jgi:hypothetical protein
MIIFFKINFYMLLIICINILNILYKYKYYYIGLNYNIFKNLNIYKWKIL